MLMFAVSIFLAFVYFYEFELNFKKTDALISEADNLANMMNTLASIEYDAVVSFSLANADNITVDSVENKIILQGNGMNVTRMVHADLQGSSSANDIIITKTGNVLEVS